jgi:5-methylcytosine-specific restriction endonuclease McrA
LKIDPGSKITGIALIRESEVNPEKQTVLYLAEVKHRSETVHNRPKRFENRTREEGWLPPSLRSRIDNITTWTDRFRCIAPITGITVENVKFDMQLMQDPEIGATLYQQGTLHGYEIREFLLEKWGRTCAYCDQKDVPLQVEHIVPLARNGSNRISNLTLACKECNQEKGCRDIREYLEDDSKRLTRILSHTKASLKDAAAVNTMRTALIDTLKLTNLPIETATGARTKYNRTALGVPKSHSLDAACTGSLSFLYNWDIPVLNITATGRGSYQRTRTDAQGMPKGYLIRKKKVFGFQTGDIVEALVPRGKKAGKYIGRVAIRASGSFNIQTYTGTVQGISWKYCTLCSHADGYSYSLQKTNTLTPNPNGARFIPDLKDGVSTCHI